MKLLGKNILYPFKKKHADARSQLSAWESEVEEAKWTGPNDVKARYPKASFVGDNQIIFNICWNKYRLLVQVSYKNEIVFIRKIGTHKEYNGWKIP